jgi:cytochrome c oxidase cbb3-type subunit 1
MSDSCPLPASAATPAESDSSCRMPVMLFFLSAAAWLVVSGLLGSLASITFISPAFMAHCPWMTYGRTHPASLNAFVYGFAMQAAMGVMLWLLCRLGQTKLPQPVVVTAAVKLWNLGVTLGVVGILAGGNTGHEWLEMPRYAAAFLFFAYLLFAVWAVQVFRARNDCSLNAVHWYILAAVLWFPWIYTCANLLLLVDPVRGVMQPLVAWWYAGNLHYVWLALPALAVLLYFVPIVMNRPLHSGQLAAFGFWTLLLFGSWMGIPSSSPLPAWMGAVSAAAATVFVVPVLAVAMNLHCTAAGRYKSLDAGVATRFMGVSLFAYVLFGVLTAVDSLPQVNVLTEFTLVKPALRALNLQGFVAFALLGAVYHIVPRLTRAEFKLPKLAVAHFYSALVGMLLTVVVLFAAGLLQGRMLNDGAKSFTDITQMTSKALAAGMAGELLLVFGGLCLLVNLGLAAVGCCRACCENEGLLPVAKSETAGVAS